MAVQPPQRRWPSTHS